MLALSCLSIVHCFLSCVCDLVLEYTCVAVHTVCTSCKIVYYYLLLFLYVVVLDLKKVMFVNYVYVCVFLPLAFVMFC